MKNMLGVVVGCSMLVVAGVVLTQSMHSNSRLGKDIKGDISELSSSGFSESEQCTSEVVDGIVRVCCGTPYTAYYNCTNYSNTFHNECDRLGINCTTVTIQCPGSGHAANAVFFPETGEWCLVEPQNGNVGPCGNSPSDISGDGICDFMGVNSGTNSSGCSCSIASVSDDPVRPNTDVDLCSETSLSMFACVTCCAQRHESQDPHADADDWYRDCYNACSSNSYSSDSYTPFSSWSSSFSSISACANSSNCAVGFISGSCDPSTCLQEFNTGSCDVNNHCAVVQLRCNDQSTCSRSTVTPVSTSSSISSSSWRSYGF